jgi:hypothetical protein
MISLGGSSGSEVRSGGKGKMGGAGEGDEEVDQVDRFLNLVDWGNVPRPAEWVEGAYDDAEEDGEGEVEDINALVRRIGAVDITQT